MPALRGAAWGNALLSPILFPQCQCELLALPMNDEETHGKFFFPRANKFSLLSRLGASLVTTTGPVCPPSGHTQGCGMADKAEGQMATLSPNVV